MPSPHPGQGIEVSAAALPTMFIASSSEGLGVASDVQELLEQDCHATIWNQGVFRPSDIVLQRLVQAAKEHDFGLFVFTPDDRMHLQGGDVQVVRDNVVFEMGLFVGTVGARRCFHVVPRGLPDMHLPSDLLGVLAVDYPTDRPDGNRLAALGPACNKLHRAMRDHRSSVSVVSITKPAAPAVEPLQRLRDAWDTPPLSDARARLRAGVPMDPHDEDMPRDELWRVFSFLESMSASVVAGEIDEAAARAAFGSAVSRFWPHAATLLAPPNDAGDFWNPAPHLAELYVRWR